MFLWKNKTENSLLSRGKIRLNIDSILFLPPPLAIIFKMVGYEFFTFSRMKNIDYLYDVIGLTLFEVDVTRKIDVLCGLTVFVANMWQASENYSPKLETCEVCLIKFNQFNCTSEYKCVCVCQEVCKRYAKHCEKCNV